MLLRLTLRDWLWLCVVIVLFTLLQVERHKYPTWDRGYCGMWDYLWGETNAD